jgi:hypothetical protein
MRKLLLALLLVLASAVPAAAQSTSAAGITCNKFFAVSQGAVALTKIITGIASQNISLCGFVYNSGAATSTVGLSYGTGTNCATGTTVLIPVVSLPINGLLVDKGDFASMAVPAVNGSGVPIDLCLVTTGTGPAVVIVHYAQF